MNSRKPLKEFFLKSIYATSILSIIFFCITLSACQHNSTTTKTHSYAEDRALIEDLQARYMFALDLPKMEYSISVKENGAVVIPLKKYFRRFLNRKKSLLKMTLPDYIMLLVGIA